MENPQNLVLNLGVVAPNVMRASVPERPVCETCGGENLAFNASVEFGPDGPVLTVFFEQGAFCKDSNEWVSVRWKRNA